MINDLDFNLMDDYEEYIPSEKHLQHARSLVGKWAVCNNGLTPHLTGYLGKVIKINDRHLGGNERQVLVALYKSKAMWNLFTWRCIANKHDMPLECIDSSHLTAINYNPTYRDKIVRIAYMISRSVVNWIFVYMPSIKWSFKYDLPRLLASELFHYSTYSGWQGLREPVFKNIHRFFERKCINATRYCRQGYFWKGRIAMKIFSSIEFRLRNICYRKEIS